MAFGVTASVVEQWTNGLVFRDAVVGPPAVAASTPSLAACTEEIVHATNRVYGFCRARGIASPESITQVNAGDTYSICRQLVLLDIVAWANRARGRNDPENARALSSERRDLLAALTDSASMGQGRNVGENAAGISRAPTPTATAPVSTLLGRMLDRGQA